MVDVISKVKIEDLISEAQSAWQQSVSDAATYKRRNQGRLTRCQALQNEYKACAAALVNYMKPYAFGKKHSTQFNWLNGCEKYFDDNVMAARGPAGLTSFEGTLDYWAATKVDPVFRDLCLQRIALRDEIKGYQPGAHNNHISFLQARDPDLTFSGIHYRPLDTLRGLRVRDQYKDYNITKSHKLLGAYDRLSQELADRFDVIMGDPVKAGIVKDLSVYFHDTYNSQATVGLTAEVARAERIKDKDPARNDVIYNKLRRLAYLKVLGFDAVDVPDGNVTKAIDTLIKRAKYKNGKSAPSFGQDDVPDYDVDLGFEDKIEAVLAKLNLVYPDRIEAGKPEPVGLEKPQRFVENFVAGAKNLATLQPTG